MVLLLSPFVLRYRCKKTRPFLVFSLKNFTLTFQDLESTLKRTCDWYRPVETDRNSSLFTFRKERP